MKLKQTFAEKYLSFCSHAKQKRQRYICIGGLLCIVSITAFGLEMLGAATGLGIIGTIAIVIGDL